MTNASAPAQHESSVSRTPAPLYWSIRREIAENRFLYLAPLIVMVVVLVAMSIRALSLPDVIRAAASLSAEAQSAAMERAVGIAPAPVMFSTFVVALFYAIDALYGERRDRSILFWKSMPVSDVTTVVSKAAIPLVVLPAIAFVLGLATNLFLLGVSTVIVAANGVNPGMLWSSLASPSGLAIMIYGLAVHALWYAPIYAWLILVSAWARRAPLVWAVLPFFLLAAVEAIVFQSSLLLALLRHRWGGVMYLAFDFGPTESGIPLITSVSQLAVGRFLGSPGLWTGLVFTALALWLAVRLRRHREPG